MFKALVLLSFFAFQADAFVSNEDIDLNLLLLKKEIEDFTNYLDTSYSNSHHAIDTITWQCHRVAETIQNVINDLKKEEKARRGDRTFKQFSFALQEVHTSLQQIALSTDVNEVTPIKSQLIANVQLACEVLEKMTHVTYSHYPDFRAKLKTILQDFCKGLLAIKKNIMSERGGQKMRWSTKELATKIEGLTQSLLKDLTVRRELMIWYRRNVELSVLRKLQSMDSVGDDEIDVVLLGLARKIKKATDVEVGEMYLSDVASLFNQLAHYVNDGSQGEKGDWFIEELIYNYYYALQSIFNRLHSDNKVLDTKNWSNMDSKKNARVYLGLL